MTATAEGEDVFPLLACGIPQPNESQDFAGIRDLWRAVELLRKQLARVSNGRFPDESAAYVASWLLHSGVPRERSGLWGQCEPASVAPSNTGTCGRMITNQRGLHVTLLKMLVFICSCRAS